MPQRRSPLALIRSLSFGVSARGSPTETLSLYAHLFGRSDEAAAKVMDEAMGLKEKQVFGTNRVSICDNRRFSTLGSFHAGSRAKDEIAQLIKRLAETEGFEPSIELYNPITV